MALPSSGAITFQDINVELGLTATAQVSMNDTAVRTLFGVASGAIGMNNGYGKSNAFTFNITSNTTNANLRTLAVNAGWNQSSAVIATVNSGVYVYSTGTNIPALTINGSWPGGIILVNNGYIIGMGGKGANTAEVTSGAIPQAGAAGGPAISLGVSVSITNNSYIAGGGGGGAAGWGGGGGGAGGGAGGTVNLDGFIPPAGSGGGPGSSGTNGGSTILYNTTGGSGGGGGRILPGVGGAAGTSGGGGQGGGAGGGGGDALFDYYGVNDFTSSAGGSANNAAATVGAGSEAGGGAGGGGWGAKGGDNFSDYIYSAAGGAGGRAVQLNGYAVTWNATGTRYGAIS